MQVLLTRFDKTKDTTFCRISIDNKTICYTVEDLERAHKEYGITAIPCGEYTLELITYGRHHTQYLNTYGATFHKGMIHLKDVPNYEGILIHKGNFAKDTLGCILPNSQINKDENRGYGSGNAYKVIYPIIRDKLLSGEKVTIKIVSDVKS